MRSSTVLPWLSSMRGKLFNCKVPIIAMAFPCWTILYRIPYNQYICHQKKPSIHAVFEVNVGFGGLASYVSVAAYQNSVHNPPPHPAGIVTSAQTLKY